MAFRLFILMIVFKVIPIISYGQQEEEDIVEVLLEQLDEEMAESVDVSEITEKLHSYLRRPLNLNVATEVELGGLLLSPQQIENLLYHRRFTGPIVSILELQAIDGFDLQLIERIRPFVRIVDESPLKGMTLKKMLDKDEGMLMFRYGRTLERQSGFNIEDESKSRYLGDPNRYALRYRWNFDNRIRIALNMEKDAGEPFFKEQQKYGFDFYSGHVELRGVNKYVKKIVVGDYALQFGQGLVAWNGLSFGKGVWIGSVARQGQGLLAYSSMNETNFMRGLATSIQKGNWEWTPFVAYNPISGKVEELDAQRTISTISVSGLHRTPTELSYRKAINQTVFGTNLAFRHRRLKLGLTYMGLRYDGHKVKGDDLRQLFDFEGKSLHSFSTHYNYSIRNYYLFGETAYSINGGWAINNGVIASLHSKLSVFANYRNYHRDYHSYFGQSLAEGSNLANEKGVYTGVVYHPSRKIEWVNYVDIFQFPWLRYRVDAPSSGTDFLSQFTYTWYKIGKLTFRYRHRLKQENVALAVRNTILLADVTRQQFRVDFQYKLGKSWRIRTRGEVSDYFKEEANSSNGYLVYQDVFWQVRQTKLQLNMRFAYFDTDYDSRIYAYENDVLYASGFPMYSEKGMRSYLNVRYKLSRNVDLWARYGLSYYPDRAELGSGLDKIQGSKKSELKLQLRWQW